MRLVMISLDMVVALPILSVAVLLLLSSIRGTQGYLLELGVSEASRLRMLSASQQIAGAVDASANYSSALLAAGTVSARYGLSAQLSDPGEAPECSAAGTACRLVTVSGMAYLMVVRNESAG